MTVFEIKGGERLQGEIYPQGAKNEALQVLNAIILTDKPVTINNIPDIEDVNKLINLLSGIGVRVEKISKGNYKFHAKEINTDFFDTEEFFIWASSLRGSVLLLGALLSRIGRAKLPNPGGDKIGRRHLDTHFEGFEKLGTEIYFDYETKMYILKGDRLSGCYILLSEASVTGTSGESSFPPITLLAII